MTAPATAPPRVLREPEWQALQAAHHARVEAWTAGHLDRRRRGEKHPVEDFLFRTRPD